MKERPPRIDLGALHALLRERLGALEPPPVAEATRHFLEVTALPCELMLWSLEFAFDEDDARVARLEARFVEHGAVDPFRDDLPGVAVYLLLPRVLPPPPPHDPSEDDASAAHAVATAEGPSLVARFVRALADLGAYRTIEAVVVRGVDVHRL